MWQVRVVADSSGASMGFGFVESRTQAAADAAVWTLHNSMLDGRVLVLRQDCEMGDVDGEEAARRRHEAARPIDHALRAHVGGGGARRPRRGARTRPPRRRRKRRRQREVMG